MHLITLLVDQEYMAEVQAWILYISMATGLQFDLSKLNLNPDLSQGSNAQLLAIVVLS